MLFRSNQGLNLHSLQWKHGVLTTGPQGSSSKMFFKVQSTEKTEWVHIRWPKYWSFSFSISPSSEYSGLISFRIDWLDLLEVQGTLRSLLQHHSSKALILGCSAFFIVQISHLYMTTRKTIALTVQTFVSNVMSLFLICCLGWS